MELAEVQMVVQDSVGSGDAAGAFEIAGLFALMLCIRRAIHMASNRGNDTACNDMLRQFRNDATWLAWAGPEGNGASLDIAARPH
jgi:hypothetical protein